MDLSIAEIDLLRILVEKRREASGGTNNFLKNLSNKLGRERDVKVNTLIPQWTEEERIAFEHLGFFDKIP